MALSEKEIQDQLLQYLKLKRVYAWRNNSGMMKSGGRYIRFGKKGSSDIIGVDGASGRFVAVEVKKPDLKWKPTPEQVDFLTEVHRHGGLAGTAITTDDVDRILSGELVIHT